MADYDVDLFVIGGGSGGVRAARIAAQHGARVMIAEEYRVGGTCVIRGCVPKKLLVYAVALRATSSRTRRASAGPCREPVFDWPTLIANKDTRNRAAGGGLHRQPGEGRRRRSSRAARVLDRRRTPSSLADGETRHAPTTS